MNWFWIALVGPALWSVCNHIDKYLLSKYFKGVGVGQLIIFSSLIGIFILPLILIFYSDVIHVTPRQGALAILSELFYLTGMWIYLYALEQDEASIVVPMFQVIPVFLFVLGFFILGETLTAWQIFGSILIIIGSISISLNLAGEKIRFKSKIFWLMMLASLLTAFSLLIFKFVAIESNFWKTVFWEYVGSILAAAALLIFISSYRRQFLKLLRTSRVAIIGMNSLNEILNVIGSLGFQFATLLAPLALVQTVNGFQPVFVFLYGVILTLLFPKIGVESLVKKHLIQKIASIAVMVVGTILINRVI